MHFTQSSKFVNSHPLANAILKREDPGLVAARIIVLTPPTPVIDYLGLLGIFGNSLTRSSVLYVFFRTMYTSEFVVLSVEEICQVYPVVGFSAAIILILSPR